MQEPTPIGKEPELLPAQQQLAPIPEPTVLEEEFNISPEHLEFAKCYLSTLDLEQTATAMRIPIEEATKMFRHKDVKTLVDTAFLDQGYMNRSKISSAMTKIIDQKLDEMEETELASGKDVSELLMMAHKMRMEEMKLMQESGPTSQTNILINEAGGKNYNALLGKIYNGGK